MTLTVREFRLLTLGVWLLLVSNIAAPGYLKFWLPSFGTIDIPAMVRGARPNA
ncbi:MAG: hypothetical protein AAFX78_03675 [Cyanobacteria bacterium J06638_20]